MHPTQISMVRYGLIDASTGFFGSELFIPREVIDGMEDGPGWMNTRYDVW